MTPPFLLNPYIYEQAVGCSGDLISTTDLIAYLKLDGNYNDSSGNGNNFTNDGTSISSSGKFDETSQFITGSTDPTSQNIRVKYTASDLIDTASGNANGFSISCWIKWESIPTTSESKIFSFNSNGDRQIDLVWNKSLDSYRLVFFNGSSAFSYDWANTPTAGNWIHVCVVMQPSTGSFNVYFDGVSRISGTDTNDGSAGSSNYTIGSHSSVARTFIGYIDDFSMFNRPLSSSEIELLAAGTCPLKAIVPPTDIANMEFWYDGSAPISSTNVADKNTVDGSNYYDRLYDFTDLGNHASNTSSVIEYKTNVQNGLSSIYMPNDPDSNRLNGYTPAYALDSTDFSFVFVADKTSPNDSVYRGILSNRTVSGSDGWFTFGTSPGGELIAEVYAAGVVQRNILTSYLPAGQGPQIYIYRKSTSTGARIERISSGSITNLGTNAATDGGGVSGLQFDLACWRANSNGQAAWFGDVFEIMFYKKYLTNDDILDIKDYIADKWEITP